MKIKRSSLVVVTFFSVISFLTILESFRVKKHLSGAERLAPLSTDVYLQALGWMIAFGAVLLLLQEVFRARHPKFEGSGTRIRDVMLTVIMFTAYVLSAEWLGYSLSTILFYFAFLRWVSKYSYTKTLTISVIITLCCDLFFVILFQMVLPAGVIENFF